MMKRDINSNQRNVPLTEALSSNKNLKLQENKIMSQQNSFMSMIPEHWKIAEIARENGKMQKAVSYIGSNSIVVDIGDSNVREAVMKLMLLPGVRKVEEEHEIKFNTFQSLEQIGATSVYDDLGMDELEIGRGIKIAVTDGGNYVNVSMMNDDGFSLPSGINQSDRGEISNTNNKLIISRAYGTYGHSYQGKYEDCHGIHTSSTAGGRRVNVTLYGHNYTLSGVAPGAWLMNYRYVGQTNDFENKMTDDVILDNPDVSSNSWGYKPVYNSNYETFKRFDRMMDNGIFVSVAIGNDGPGALTAGASVEKAIVVGACTKEDIVYYNLEVPGFGKNYTCIASKQTLGIKDSYNLVVLRDGIENGCDSSLGLTFSDDDAVLLLRSNNCKLYEKAVNMKSYGSGLMIIGETFSYKYNTTILPSIHCYNTDVRELIDYVYYYGSTSMNLTRVRDDESTQDMVAEFSSRGPTQDMKLVPDVVAPGVNVLAAGYGDGEDPRLGYNYVSGTSMATPIVSGAAAIIIQKHPEFTTEEVKSALMTTADFVNVTRWEDGEPAQPLDMGAGRINLKKAINPTLYISPPKVDFSLAQKPAKYSKTLKVHSYSSEEIAVSVRIVLHSGYNNITSAGTHLSAEPSEFTLSSTSDVDVTFSLDTKDVDLGDQNAYVIFENQTNGEEIAHVPLWGQVIYPKEEKKDILLFVVDKNTCNEVVSESIVDVYKNALDKANLSYDVIEYCYDGTTTPHLPEKAIGLGYKAVLLALNKNVNKPLFKYMEGEIRRMMHAGVPVIQMGKTLPYSWYKIKSGIKWEFGIEDANQLLVFVKANSDYLVSDTKVPRKVDFNLHCNIIYKTNDNKPIVVSTKDIIGAEEERTINSVGVTSFVGLEDFKEENRTDVVLKSFWNGLERGSNIKTVISVNNNVASFNVSTTIDYSGIDKIFYNCGDGNTGKTVYNSSFECTYNNSGNYKVKYWVYTNVVNCYRYISNVNITSMPISSLSSYSLSSSSESDSISSTRSFVVPSILMIIVIVLYTI